MAAVAALVLASLAAIGFAADNVAPTNAELEDMYNAAYRAFDAKKFSEALKQLDAIDARQPDLPASKNLRGVILMRQGKYDEAETALQEASRIDPKFWNARFNQAEIPFLKKDWAEARKRFEQLLASGGSDLAKEASQLIQYKILLTYLQQGNGNMVDSMLAKLELSPDTPAVDYVKAAVALQAKNQSEAKDWISAAEKNYSPQLNKLFAESLYEAGWLEKPVGEGRPSLPLMTAAERSEKTKAAARSKFEQSQQALLQGDFATALKLIDEADQADPNEPAILNLRGEILMAQQRFDQAEAAFKKAARLDPKLREAQYNLAQIPFKKKDYAKAQERFEALYNRIPGGDKNQAAELIKFKIYMALLLEGKESRAHTIMEEFQFTGDTPALYYAQAAWEYKHNNAEKAQDWTNSANKIYSPALNSVFADAFYDVGWIQRPEGSSAPALAFDTANVVAPQTEGAPAVEPSPIAANKRGEASSGEALALAPAAKEPNAGTEIASAEATPIAFGATSASSESTAETSPQPEQPTSESPATGGEATTTAAQAVAAETPQAASASSNEQNKQQASVQTSPPEKSALRHPPTKVLTSASGTIGTLFAVSRRTWMVAGLLLAGIFLLPWVIVPVVRQHAFNVPRHLRLEPPSGAAAAAAISKPRVAPAQTTGVRGNGFVGGPRQITARLTASTPFSPSRSYELAGPDGAFHRAIGPHDGDSAGYTYRQNVADATGIRTVTQFKTAPAAPREEPSVLPVVVAEVVPTPATELVAGGLTEPPAQEQAIPEVPSLREEPSVLPVVAEVVPTPATELVAAGLTEPPVQEQAIREVPPLTQEPSMLPVVAEVVPTPATELVAAGLTEPPPRVHAYGVASSTAEAVHEVQHSLPTAIHDHAASSQTATPATMPEPTQTPLVPLTKAPDQPLVAKLQPPPGTMHTAVELTFSFEVASVQLTPAFKVGALQVRPASKMVTMRLAPFQDSQPATNSEVAFEISNVRLAGDALDRIQVVRSQQQKPLAVGSPSFAIPGLQFVPDLKAAPFWLTPSQPGRAPVKVRAAFQISAIQFSPSFEVASIVLNPSSKRVRVQLPGLSSSTAEGASIFEIAKVQVTEGGDMGIILLNLLDQGSKLT